MSYSAPVDDILFTLRHIARARPAMADGSPLEWDEVAAILDESGRFTSEIIAPLDVIGDRIGARFENGSVFMPPGFDAGYRAWRDAGWNAIALPPSHGGSGLPTTIGTATMEMLTSACMALSTLPVLSQGGADAIEAHGSAELKSRYLPKLTSGEWTATMNLTEPQAGSDLGLLRSRAEPVGDGTYRLFGQKIFITFGEHDLVQNIVHLVLARLPDAPAGTRGISLFLVPKFLPDGARNDLRCTGIEHKLGIKASPTCSMSFGEAGGAIGWLIGEANNGLACMFTMMNKARLATGLQGVAMAERAYQRALAFAQERRQGRAAGVDGPAPIITHPDIRRTLVRMRALTAASRALAYLAATAIDEGDETLAGLLTPVVKAFSTDIGVEVASHGIQVHGGMGYVEETGAAQHLRDIRIAPIYEGTNAIQAIDLVMRKLPRGNPALERLVAAARADLAAATVLGPAGAILAEAVDGLEAAIRHLAGREITDEARLYVAPAFLRLFAVAVSGTLLARGAAAASNESCWPALARLYAEDIAIEAPALLRTILSTSRDPTDYARALGL